jgi:tocopherol cyclase
MLGINKPTSLRGYFTRNKYFEGWFQKVYSTKHKASFVIIYGYATSNSYENFGFIQLLIPDKASEILYFSKNEISFDSERHIVRMGDNLLTTELISIKSNDITIDLNLLNNQPIGTFKNSMGYTYYIPKLPCYHSVLNTSHCVSGEIEFKKARYLFDKEIGYLEKNWGTSFPENYCWLHAVDPNDSQISLLFSMAEIKWLGKQFIKHVGHFRFDGTQIDLRELNNIAVDYLTLSRNKQVIRIASKTILIELSITVGNKVIFKGPAEGKLSRDIIHFTDEVIDVSLTQNNKTRLFQLVGNFENIGSLGF